MTNQAFSPTAPAGTSRIDALRKRPKREGEASFFYYDPVFKSDAVKVLPGEYFVYDEDLVVVTVLGSCIAACLWDRQARVGGMNHFMLPDGGAQGGDSGRYGVFAMELLINELIKRGARKANLEAKIFGGGQVMQNFTSMNVGERNAEFVMHFLHTERIPILSKDVLDIYPRKVCFFPASGRALVKKLAHAHDKSVVQEEQSYSQQIAKPTPSAGSIELF
jgi:chemotaxis protein CheD